MSYPNTNSTEAKKYFGPSFPQMTRDGVQNTGGSGHKSPQEIYYFWLLLRQKI